ncbi:MAG: 2-succinyl-5-enolpyruvyl-6-hydroxy-3-cyclohexene-1-carboxylic-acid synthase [Actinomycetes bacterium]
MSVVSPSDTQATYVATLVDQWIACGLRDVVICPGSRSTPMTLALARRSELQVSVRLDERGAGFYAIGRALESRLPVAIVVTSGTAAAELHAAVAEADQAYVPLIVITADRPPELHGVGAPQTIPQHELFGPMVRRALDPGVANPLEANTWRDVATELWNAARGVNGRSGPVHLNAAFIEPLLGEAQPLPTISTQSPQFPRAESLTPVTPDVAGQRVLAVFGNGATANDVEAARQMNWVVVGDVTTPHATAYVDGFLRNEEFARYAKPDVVIRLGGLVASKVVNAKIKAWGVPVIGLDTGRPVSDPDQVVTETLAGSGLGVAPSGVADAAYSELWSKVETRAHENFAGLDLESSKLTEALIAREVVCASNETQIPLLLGSSMPVREVEWFAPARTARVFSNRGVNGIDGVTSTLFGIGAGGAAIGLIGDLTFLHDASAMVDPPDASIALVVVANNGGHIFDFLPQKSTLDPGEFERLFTTPRTPQPSKVAAGFGMTAVVVETVAELRDALAGAHGHRGVTVIEAVPSAPVSNVEFHAWLERSLSRVANEFVTPS